MNPSPWKVQTLVQTWFSGRLSVHRLSVQTRSTECPVNLARSPAKGTTPATPHSISSALDPPLEARAAAVVAAVRARLDDALVAWGVDAVNRVAANRRVVPYHVALAVPGLVHAHAPDRRVLAHACAFCRRRGNCFAERGDCGAGDVADNGAQEPGGPGC